MIPGQNCDERRPFTGADMQPWLKCVGVSVHVVNYIIKGSN